MYKVLSCLAVTPSAQLLEQTARLQSLSDTLSRLKVTKKKKNFPNRVLSFILSEVVSGNDSLNTYVAGRGG